MIVVTLLSPNSKLRSPYVFSKKFGDHPRSTSKPTTFGFQPSVAPKSIRRSTSSSASGKSPKSAEPPKLPPTNGEKNQLCADALTGAKSSESAPIINNLRIAPPKVCRETNIHPHGLQAPCPKQQTSPTFATADRDKQMAD